MVNPHPLRVWREAERLTQAQFGARVGLSKTRISSIEAGEACSVEAAIEIERATRGAVRIEDLIAALRERAAQLERGYECG